MKARGPLVARPGRIPGRSCSCAHRLKYSNRNYTGERLPALGQADGGASPQDAGRLPILPRGHSSRTAESAFDQNRSHWRAAVRSKDSSPVRRGTVGKGLRKLHLAGRLPYRKHGSAGGGRKRTQPVTWHRSRMTSSRTPAQDVPRLPPTRPLSDDGATVPRCRGR
jgi:hypothetical protein